MDDVLLNKAAAIASEPCVSCPAGRIILNLQRACETSIDAAMHLVRLHRLGVPQEAREAFSLLETQACSTTRSPIDQLRKMVGFRNVAIHEYQKLDLDIVRRIVAESLDDFLAFTRILLKA